MDDIVRNIGKTATELKGTLKSSKKLSIQTADDVISRANEMPREEDADSDMVLELCDVYLPGLLYTARSRKATQQNKSYTHLEELYKKLKVHLQVWKIRKTGGSVGSLHLDEPSQGHSQQEPVQVNEKEDGEDGGKEESNEVHQDKSSICPQDEDDQGLDVGIENSTTFSGKQGTESTKENKLTRRRHVRARVIVSNDIADLDVQNEKFSLISNPVDTIKPEGSTDSRSSSGTDTEVFFGRGDLMRHDVSTEIELCPFQASGLPIVFQIERYPLHACITLQCFSHLAYPGTFVISSKLTRIKHTVKLSVEKLDDSGVDDDAEDCCRIGERLTVALVDLNVSIISGDKSATIHSKTSDFIRLHFSAFLYVMKEYSKKKKLGMERWPDYYKQLVEEYNALVTCHLEQEKKAERKRKAKFGEEDESSSFDEETARRRERWSKMTLVQILDEDEEVKSNDLARSELDEALNDSEVSWNNNDDTGNTSDNAEIENEEATGPLVASSTMMSGHSTLPEFDLSSVQ